MSKNCLFRWYTSRKNSCIISFNANDYTKYKIYSKDSGKKELIKEVSSYEGEYSFIDTNIRPNISYTYSVEASNSYADKNYISNERTIKITKEYDNLLSNDNSGSFDWIFA